MILQALAQLAKTENLLADEPDYEFRRVAWGISISATGKFQKLIPYRIDRNADTARKESFVGKWSLVPRQPIRTGVPKAFFLVDKCEYILGLDPAGKRKEEDLVKRSTLFREHVEAWHNETGCKVAKSVLAFLNGLKGYQSAVKKDKSFIAIESNELLSFLVSSKWAHRENSAKKYWTGLRMEPVSEDETFQCLVTGEQFIDSGLFPKLKNVPGGSPSEISLVSFNQTSFESFELSGNENAPISRSAAEICGVALTRLLDSSFPNPAKGRWDEKLAKRSLRLGKRQSKGGKSEYKAQTAICFWTREKTAESENTLNALESLIHGEDESSVEKNLKSIWYGRPAKLKKPNELSLIHI